MKPTGAIRAFLTLGAVSGALTASPAVSGAESVALSEALDLAIARNPALAAAQAQRQAAAAGVTEARSAYFPRVSISGSYARYDQPSIVVPIHEAGVFPPLDNDIYEGALQATVPLFNRGRTGASVRAAVASQRDKQARTELSRSGVLQGVGRVYLRSAELADRAKLVESQAAILEQRRRELSARLAEGRAAPSDVALVVSSIESLRSDSLQIELGHLELAVELARLLDVGPTASPRLPDSPAAREIPATLLPMPERPANPGPLVQSAEAQLERAEAVHDQAGSFFWPEIAGFGSYVLRSGDDLDPTGEWVAGVRLDLPLFDGGRRSAVKGAARASTEAAQKRLEEERTGQRAALRRAADAWRVSEQKRVHLASAMRSMSESVTAYRALYEGGRIPLTDLLTQEARLLDLGIEERRAAYDQRHALLDYHATLGELAPDPVVAIVEGTLP